MFPIFLLLFIALVPVVPRVHSLPSRIYLALGLSGRIDCPADANPPVTGVTWSKNGAVVDTTSGRFRTNRHGSLVVLPVQRDDEGHYACTPHSSVGVGQQSVPVQVLVRGEKFNCYI